MELLTSKQIVEIIALILDSFSFTVWIDGNLNLAKKKKKKLKNWQWQIDSRTYLLRIKLILYDI